VSTVPCTDQDVGARFLDHLRALLGAGGYRRYSARHTGRLDRLNSFSDELRLDRLAIDLLEHCVDLGLVGLGDPLDDRVRILISRVHSIEVQDCDAT